MKEKIEKIKKEISDKIKKVKDRKTLLDLENEYFARKGKFTAVLRSIKDLSVKEKKTAGRLANEAKTELLGELEKLKEKFSSTTKKDFRDVTMPAPKAERGHLNPVTITQNELEDLFSSMGFMILDGPELESDFYCFTALNFEKNHPARDTQDTFYIDKKNKDDEYDLVMRTHTSPVQVRAMREHGAPIRCVAPGRVFRSEEIDASHEHTFHQMEGLVVDKNISIANMIAVMQELLRGIFGSNIKTRVRPGYFPFVEPGVELDISCMICNGKGCPTCKQTGWVELLPAGMVHPNVLRYGDIDPEKYSGFAFGLGFTRLVMMKYGIDDIRLFNGGDLRQLRQF